MPQVYELAVVFEDSPEHDKVIELLSDGWEPFAANEDQLSLRRSVHLQRDTQHMEHQLITDGELSWAHYYVADNEVESAHTDAEASQ